MWILLSQRKNNPTTIQPIIILDHNYKTTVTGDAQSLHIITFQQPLHIDFCSTCILMNLNAPPGLLLQIWEPVDCHGIQQEGGHCDWSKHWNWKVKLSYFLLE
jgi:hypothetical protein